MAYYAEHYNENIKSVMAELEAALSAVEPEVVEKFVQTVLEADQVFFIGVGRVLLSLQSMCKRFAHLGIKAHYVGDITEPCFTDNDLLIVGSGSGGSLFPLNIAKKAR
ncbi:MAG: sugar isomerase, partial [Dorea sp.]|nr:sugar isomerase [Dorea sp.]